MTELEFNLLADVEKEEEVFEHATYLINFDEGNMLCDVYELWDFYVAIYYDMKRNLLANIETAIHANDLVEL